VRREAGAFGCREREGERERERERERKLPWCGGSEGSAKELIEIRERVVKSREKGLRRLFFI
jgi:hypothetical protein